MLKIFKVSNLECFNLRCCENTLQPLQITHSFNLLFLGNPNFEAEAAVNLFAANGEGSPPETMNL